MLLALLSGVGPRAMQAISDENSTNHSSRELWQSPEAPWLRKSTLTYTIITFTMAGEGSMLHFV